MSAHEDIGRLFADQLQLLDQRLTSGDWLCCCGPCYLVEGTYWAYSRELGWHSPSDQHAALWPTGGAT